MQSNAKTIMQELSITFKQDLSALNKIERAEQEITAKLILGYDLYPAQNAMIDFCYKKDSRQVKMCLGSRKYGKTDVVVVLKVIEILKEDPQATFLIATKELSRTSSIIETIGIHLQALGFKGSFASKKIQLKENKRNKQDNIKAVTPRASSLRGNHADYLICDDIIVDTDENSPRELARAKTFFSESVNVAERIIILGQPVHEEDLYAMLSGDKVRDVVDCMRFFNGTIPELDRDLEVLRDMGISERSIRKNYYGELIADGFYPFGDIKVEGFSTPKGEYIIATIDPAFDGEDRVAVSLGYIKDDKYYVRVASFDGNIFELKEEIGEYLRGHNVSTCYIESNDNGGVYRVFEDSDYSRAITFYAFRETLNKEVRIKTRIGAVASELILAGADAKYVLQWNGSSKVDDVPDSVASLINFLNSNPERLKYNGRVVR